MSNNVYNTSDPERLLRLKRLEAEALRDVIRAFKQFHHKPNAIFKITQNTLLAQLGVGKMMFLYEAGHGIQTGILRGFSEPDDRFIRELPRKSGVSSVDPAQSPVLQASGIENIITLPLNDQSFAWFMVADFAETDSERENDLIFIETLGHVLTAVLENNFLVAEMLRQEGVRSQLEVAERIQQQLLPTDFDDIRGAEVAAFNEPHHRVGGDYYDVIPRGEKGFFICMADVSGKGIGAALLMANLQAQLRALILSEDSLAAVVTKLNRNLLNITGGDQFVTLFLAHARIADRKLDYINAGHHYPLLKRSSGIQELKDGTIPLGLMDLPMVNEGSVDWVRGDKLFLYTDGLPDQPDARDEKFGETAIHQAMENWNAQDPAEWIAELIEKWKGFAGGTTATDDITLLALRFKP